MTTLPPSAGIIRIRFIGLVALLTDERATTSQPYPAPRRVRRTIELKMPAIKRIPVQVLDTERVDP